MLVHVSLTRRWSCWGYYKWAWLVGFSYHAKLDPNEDREVLTQQLIDRIFRFRWLLKYMTKGKPKTIKLSVTANGLTTDMILKTHRTKFSIMPYNEALHGRRY